MEEIKKEKGNNFKEIFEFIKKHQTIFIYLLLIGIIIYSGVYIRTLDMPTLKDVSTGNLTLAQDLDPYLFLRWAQTISDKGYLPQNDSMRYVPLGYDTTNELTLPSYIIAYMYKIGIFSSIEMSAIMYPLIFYILFVIAFFLFVKKVFSKNSASGWIAIIATGIMSIIPGLLHRTLAGVPEKEPGGLCMMFFALYFMACFLADDKKTWKAWLFGSLAGICTGIMGLLWGGIMAMFLIGPAVMILIFFLSDIDYKDTIFYLCWVSGFTIILLTCTTKYGLAITSPVVAGLAYFVALVMILKVILKKKSYAIIASIIILSAGIIILNPHFNGKSLFDYITTDAYNLIITPFSTNRLAVTVAENQITYVSSWIQSFGSAMFWAFIFSLLFIGYETFSKKESGLWGNVATSGFFIMSAGMIISKYSPALSSNLIFFACLIYFIATLIMLCIKKPKDLYIDKTMLLFISSLLFAVFCGRSVIRMFYFIYPFVPIAISFMLIKSCQIIKKKEEGEMMKLFSWIAIGCLLFTIPASVYAYNGSIIQEAKYSGTNYYSAQWQLAMGWVRENTPKDAVFAHWWDYGYWVQSIGQRATILDGGNAISYWDYLMGRTLTQDIDNETFAFEFLKTHKADYLLIDPTDIGKYPAYSTIGSNENYDRASQISTFILNPSLEKETRNQTIKFYTGGGSLEEDTLYNGEIYPAGTPIIGMSIIISSATKEIEQPMIIIYYQNRNIYIPVIHVYNSGIMLNFNSESAIDGCVYIMPQISQEGFSSSVAALWLSPRLMKSTMVNLYLLNAEIPGYKLVHSEPSIITSQLSNFYQQYNITPSEIAYYPGLGNIGPIKIWAIDYSAHPEANKNMQYLNITFPTKEAGLK